MKALESRRLPYMAILDCRNMPTQDMDSSPAQMLINWQTKTHLPTLRTRVMYQEREKCNLVKTQGQQAKYYNHGARDPLKACRRWCCFKWNLSIGRQSFEDHTMWRCPNEAFTRGTTFTTKRYWSVWQLMVTKIWCRERVPQLNKIYQPTPVACLWQLQSALAHLNL